MSLKKLLIIIIIAGGAALGFFLWHSHKVGIEQGRNEHHWLKDLLGENSEPLSALDEGLSADEEQFPGWEGEKNTDVKVEKNYVSFDQVSTILGNERFQKFKTAFETDEYVSATNFTEATLYPDVIDNGSDKLTFYVFTNDDAGSKYEIHYYYGDDMFEISPVSEFPTQNDVRDEATETELQDEMTDEDVEGDGDVTYTPPASTGSSTGATSSSTSSSANTSSNTTQETVEVKNYYTVNGVQFDNVVIYEVLSDEAVNLFTNQVTSWWSSNGENRRTIRTSKPVKNGSKVTFTVEYVEGSGSFQATLDLNKESFSFE